MLFTALRSTPLLALLLISSEGCTVTFSVPTDSELASELFDTLSGLSRAFRGDALTIQPLPGESSHCSTSLSKSSSRFSNLCSPTNLTAFIACTVKERNSEASLFEAIEEAFIHIAPPKPRAHNCLLPDELANVVPNCISYSGRLRLPELVAFVNLHCALSRDPDGSLNEIGQAEQEMLSNLFDSRSLRSSSNKDDAKSSEIPTCEVLESLPSREVFLRDYVSRSRPVIIRGVSKHWPALQKWSNDFLLENFGHRSVHVKLGERGDFEGCEPIALWEAEGADIRVPDYVYRQLESPDKLVVRPARLDIPFRQFVELLYSADPKLANVTFYIEYSAIETYFPQMQSDVAPPDFASDLRLEHSNAWIGNGRTLGKLHFDPFENLLCMIAGKKRLDLFPPHNNEELYEGHIREGQLSFSLETGQFSRTNLLDSTSMVMSPIDILRPDLERYPRYAQAEQRRMQCEIAEGDALYLPAFWWHEVRSSPDVQRRNIAVNYWYSPLLDKEFPCPDCRLRFNRKQYAHLLRYGGVLSRKRSSDADDDLSEADES